MLRKLTASIMSLVTVLAGVTLAASPAKAVCKDWRPEELHSGDVMCPNNIVWADGGRYMLKMQADGNLVLYHLAQHLNPGSADRVMWAWKGAGPGATATMRWYGRFEYLFPNSENYMRRSLAAPPASFLKVQDDGKLVIYTWPDEIPVAESCLSGGSFPTGYTFCAIR
jgi:hypothetical protein